MIRPMTRTRALGLAISLTMGLGGATLLLQPQAAQAAAAGAQSARATVAPAQGEGGPNTYFSAPPNPFAARGTVKHVDKRPTPPPTRGTVTGQVTGPNGTPIANALVTGIRFSDLGLPVDVSEEKRVLART